MKKSASIAGGVLATALLLGACGNGDANDTNTTGTEDTATEPGTVTDDSTTGTDESTDSTNSGTNDDAASSDNDQDYMKEQMDKLAYDEFELEVDYGKDKEYEIEIEQDNGQIEAAVEDELSNNNLKGKDAFDEIYPRLENLDISETTSKDEAIKQTLDAFNLKDDYVKFEIEITMPDGQKIEFEDKK